MCNPFRACQFMSTKQLYKELRKKFRDGVFQRDQYTCRVCGKPAIDAHHITDRHCMPNDGYALSNGVSLCSDCHIKAEKGVIPSSDLYSLIGSSYGKALEDSDDLC
jgi:5-methylcytosine-specific restriction endonuclease McrA